VIVVTSDASALRESVGRTVARQSATELTRKALLRIDRGIRRGFAAACALVRHARSQPAPTAERATAQCQRGKDMSTVSAGNQQGWRVGREHSHNALEVVLLERTYVLPWAQFLYAEGGDDEVRLVFATHDVLARGAGLQLLLVGLTAHRLVGLDEPTRAARFGDGSAGRWLRELSIHKIDS
jgi:hypothetical protein